MASDFVSSQPFIIKRVRLAWADIFKPDEKRKKYKVSGIFDIGSDNEALCKKAMVEAARLHWGDNAVNVIRAMSSNSKFLRKGDDKLNDDGSVNPDYAGKMFISAGNKVAPQVVAQKRYKGEFVSIGQDGKGYVKGMDVTKEIGYPITVPYRGCYVNLKIEAVAGKAFQAKKEDGSTEQVPNQVYARLLAVQFLEDGDAFGPGQTSAEGFDDEDVGAVAVTAAGNDPDDLGF